MAKILTDTQLVILSTACQRDDRSVYPISANLTGGALAKVLSSMLGKGLLEEVPATLQDTVWRTDGDERRLTLKASSAVDVALGITDKLAASEGAADNSPRAFDTTQPKAVSAQGVRKSERGAEARKGRPSASKGKERRSATKRPSGQPVQAKQRKPRTGTKQDALTGMLRRKEGASIEEVVKALKWQPHTVRGAIAGALKKKLGLKIASEKDEKRGRVYRIDPA